MLLLSMRNANQEDTSPSGGEIKIIGPPALKEQYASSHGKIDAMPALFGIPVYNGHFVGVMKTCNEQIEACDEIPVNYFQSDPLDENTKQIALVERGSCTFVQKVRNCEKAGAKGVVVYNNVESGKLPFMSDDGTGDSVSIPSIIIDNKNGLILKSNINDDSLMDVEIEVAWGLPRPDGRVEWELWISSEMTSREKQFVADFKDVVSTLEDKHLFTPHYKISNGMMEASEEDCSNNRKYCIFGVGGVPGNQLLRETLTQICLWKIGQDLADSLIWWDYVEMFNTKCAGDETKWDGICSAFVVKNLSEDPKRSDVYDSLKKCVFDSGGLDGQANVLFDAEITSFYDYGI